MHYSIYQVFKSAVVPYLRVKARIFPRWSTDAALREEWDEVRDQLLRQWQRITPEELDRAGPDRHAIAVLIARKYGLPVELLENYLRNFERTIPLVS